MKRRSSAIVFATLFVFACGAGQTSRPQPGLGAGGVAPTPALPALAPSEPPARLGMVERYGWQTVEQMRDAYIAGDAEVFLAKVSRGFYRGYANLEASLQRTFASAAKVDLAIAIQEIVAEEDRLSVRVKWNRTLTLKSGVMERLAGESVLIFQRTEETLRLIDYRKDPIFGIAGI